MVWDHEVARSSRVSRTKIIIFMEDDFDAYKIQVDSDCVSSDFDDYDLYGEIMEESDDDFGDDFELE